MRLLALLMTAFALVTIPVSPAFAQERIAAPAGISIEKPKGWRIIPPDAALANLRGLQLDSPEYKRAADTIRAPFITLIKYDPEHAGINPTIKVNRHPLPPSGRGMTAVQVMEQVAGSMRAGFADAEILDAPEAAPFAGGQGAHVRLSFTVRGADGTPYKNVSEMWLVVRGDHVMLIGVGYGPGEPEATRAEILATVASFRID